MSHAAQSLDVAADTQEELSEWVAKIREATQNADARVRGTGVWRMILDGPNPSHGPQCLRRRSLRGRLSAPVFPCADARGEDHGAEEEDRAGAFRAGRVLPPSAV